jgi:hypothetical protein
MAGVDVVFREHFEACKLGARTAEADDSAPERTVAITSAFSPMTQSEWPSAPVVGAGHAYGALPWNSILAGILQTSTQQALETALDTEQSAIRHTKTVKNRTRVYRTTGDQLRHGVRRECMADCWRVGKHDLSGWASLSVKFSHFCTTHTECER